MRADGIGRPQVRDPGTGELVGEVALADGRRVKVTAHCVDRFWERAASGCVGFADALARLQVLATQIGEIVERPAWLAPDAEAAAWLALGPGLVLAVNKKGVAVTCLARASMSDAARAAANQRRRRRPPNHGRRRDRARDR